VTGALSQDLRLGVRQLARSPAFAALAMLMLGLGLASWVPARHAASADPMRALRWE
jgi:ABC-type lipoprotein release transport system permease subunit